MKLNIESEGIAENYGFQIGINLVFFLNPMILALAITFLYSFEDINSDKNIRIF